jgi:nicotinamide-nucleotide amidase
MFQPPRSPTVFLLSQGDEVITGQTVDTNASTLSQWLTELGFLVSRRVTVGDVMEDIVAAIAEGLQSADVLICTGGLGPTADDLTAEALATVLGVPLALHEPSLEHIQAIFNLIGRRMSDANRKQAMLPQGATPLQNNFGTAPGFCVESPREGQAPSVGYFLPGVPREMKGMWAEHLNPDLIRRFSLSPGRLVTFRCMGAPESQLEEIMRPFQGLDGVTVGFRAMSPEVQVKLRVRSDVTEGRLSPLIQEVQAAIGKAVFGVDTGALEEVIVAALIERGETLATAESCTGGRLSAAITSVAGASATFMEGACVYANEAKMRTCDVDAGALAQYGAVSEIVARQLAEGIRARAGTTYGLSTTGVAGPGGGTPEKPVGTVHVALATPQGTFHRQLRLGGDRDRITRYAAASALDLLRRHLQGVLGEDKV